MSDEVPQDWVDPTLPPAPDPTLVPDPALAPVVGPRALDAIHADVIAARTRHEAAIAELKAAGGVWAAFVREYEVALTWFQKDYEIVKTGVEEKVKSGEAWLASIENGVKDLFS